MKNYVFVGGTSGIGQAAAVEVAKTGAAVLVVGRDRERGQGTAERLRAAGAGEATWLEADLLSLAGIERAGHEISAWKPSLDGLVHSAMTVNMGGQRRLTVDGFELAFGLQYLARAALNRALRPRLAGGRIVHVAAKPPKSALPDLEDLQFERRKWSLISSLMSSQVLGFLHVQEAARRWPEVALSLACVGPTMTESIRTQPLWVRALYGVIATTPEKSARNVVRFLTDPETHSGKATLSSGRFVPTPVAYDPALAERVWMMTT